MYKRQVQRTVIVGGYDAWRVADLLKDKKVDVVLRRVHSPVSYTHLTLPTSDLV